MREYGECLNWVYKIYPEKIESFIQSVAPKQIRCKEWLVEELLNIPYEFNSIQLYGGWFGYPLIELLSKEYTIKELINIDIDSVALKICQKYSRCFNHHFVKTLNAYVTDQFESYDTDLVINTSSEHMDDLPKLIYNKRYKPSCVFALQSNNMDHLEEHINCTTSEDELVEKSGLSKILYKGTQVFDNYERYMVIGLA